jgi:TonB family protein
MLIRFILCAAIFIGVNGLCKAQTLNNTESDSTKTLITPEKMPEYTAGGEQGLMKYIAGSVKYPALSRKKNQSGLVLISFIVNENGSIQDIKVSKSSGYPLLDEEALRVVSSMPGNWKPGEIDGKPVPVQYNLPVRFSLK